MDAEREAREVLGLVTKNWSFEMHIGCPDLASEIESAIAALPRPRCRPAARTNRGSRGGSIRERPAAIGVAVSIESRSPIRRAIHRQAERHKRTPCERDGGALAPRRPMRQKEERK